MSIVLNHIFSLVDIDIYPPKSGDIKNLILLSESGKCVFPGKMNYWLDKEEFDPFKVADLWTSFTAIRRTGSSTKEGEVFHTSTALLPLPYDGMALRVLVVYTDGERYLSCPFAMPSLYIGEENKLSAKDFGKIDDPVKGYFGGYYGDTTTDDIQKQW